MPKLEQDNSIKILKEALKSYDITPEPTAAIQEPQTVDESDWLLFYPRSCRNTTCDLFRQRDRKVFVK
jgi:hypothetical protein